MGQANERSADWLGALDDGYGTYSEQIALSLWLIDYSCARWTVGWDLSCASQSLRVIVPPWTATGAVVISFLWWNTNDEIG